MKKKKPERTYQLGPGATLTTNVEGFDPSVLKKMTADDLRKIIEGEEK